jgi:hypothetical protein
VAKSYCAARMEETSDRSEANNGESEELSKGGVRPTKQGDGDAGNLLVTFND